MKRSVSLSIDSDVLARVERLTHDGENRSMVVERLLRSSLRAAEEAELDAIYDRALAAHPITDAERQAQTARMRAAYRSVHGPRK
jgi:hypothetical protein